MVLRKIRVTGLVAVAAPSLAPCVKVDDPDPARSWPDPRTARAKITPPATPPPERSAPLTLH